MLDRRLQAVGLPFFTGLAGVAVGAAMFSRADDNITARTIRIVDENGSERMLADENGIVLSGEGSGSSVQIKAGGRPQIVFLRDGSNFLTLGELKEVSSGKGTLDGLAAYREGAIRILLVATKAGGFFTLDTVEEADNIEDFLDRKSSTSTFASISAEGESPEVAIGNSNGKSKSLNLSDEGAALKD